MAAASSRGWVVVPTALVRFLQQLALDAYVHQVRPSVQGQLLPLLAKIAPEAVAHFNQARTVLRSAEYAAALLSPSFSLSLSSPGGAYGHGHGHSHGTLRDRRAGLQRVRAAFDVLRYCPEGGVAEAAVQFCVRVMCADAPGRRASRGYGEEADEDEEADDDTDEDEEQADELRYIAKRLLLRLLAFCRPAVRAAAWQ